MEVKLVFLSFAVSKGASEVIATTFKLPVEGSGVVAFWSVFVKHDMHGAMDVDGFHLGLHQLKQGVGPAIVIVIADAVAVMARKLNGHGDVVWSDLSFVFRLRFGGTDGQQHRKNGEE